MAKSKGAKGKEKSKTAKRIDKVPQSKREVLYEAVKAKLCIGEGALTAKQGKELLGWEEEADKVKFGNAYLFKTGAGNKVRCTNNITNRPFYPGVALTLKQEILRGKWQFNGEPIIIGKTGEVLNGQHQMVGLALAVEDWMANPEQYPHWESEPVIDKAIIYGVSEDDAIVNTMDTCKPRSLADVLYRSEYFSKLKEGDRRMCARICDYAIRLVWFRTGAGLDAFAPRRTHAESLDFLGRHPKLLQAVRHIHEESGKEGRIAKFISPGHAAGFLYLMAASNSDRDAYDAKPAEKSLDLGNWDAACDYWVNLAAGGKETKVVKDALVKLANQDGGTSNAEKWATIALSWEGWLDGKKIKEKHVTLTYSEDANGMRRLSEHPSVGGIDLGSPKEVDEELIKGDDPDEETINKRARKARIKPDLRPKMAGKVWAKGDIAWVRDPSGEHYVATLTDNPYDCDDDRVRVLVEAPDGEFEVDVKDISLQRPTDKTEEEEPAAPKPKPKSPLSTKPSPKGKSKRLFKVKDNAWVVDDDPWQGRIIEINDTAKMARLKVNQGHKGAGNVVVVALDLLRAEQPRISA